MLIWSLALSIRGMLNISGYRKSIDLTKGVEGGVSIPFNNIKMCEEEEMIVNTIPSTSFLSFQVKH